MVKSRDGGIVACCGISGLSGGMIGERHVYREGWPGMRVACA